MLSKIQMERLLLLIGFLIYFTSFFLPIHVNEQNSIGLEVFIYGAMSPLYGLGDCRLTSENLGGFFTNFFLVFIPWSANILFVYALVDFRRSDRDVNFGGARQSSTTS